MEGYKMGDALPAKAPTLKNAALMAIDEIEKGITPDCAVTGETVNGEFKDVAFENGALLTIPAEYNVTGYKQVLEIVVKEIRD